MAVLFFAVFGCIYTAAQKCTHRRAGLRDEGGEGGEEVVAVVGADLEHDRFVEVEAENAENGLRVHDIFAALEREVEVAARGEVHKLFDRFRGV